MKNMKIIKGTAVLVSLSVVIVAIGFGCGVGYTPNGSATGSSVTEPPSTLPGNIDGLVYVPGASTFGTPIYTAFYNSLLSKLNLNPAVPAQVTLSAAEFTRQREALSENGKATAINAPFTFAVISLSAAACLDRINFELNNPGSKLFYNEVDLAAGPGQLTDDVLRMVINRLARGLYADNPMPAEVSILLADVKASMDSDTNNAAVETRNAMLYLCTSMSSSTLGLAQ